MPPVVSVGATACHPDSDGKARVPPMRLPGGERHELAPSHCHYSVGRSVPYARPCHRAWLKHRAKKHRAKKHRVKKHRVKKGGSIVLG